MAEHEEHVTRPNNENKAQQHQRNNPTAYPRQHFSQSSHRNQYQQNGNYRNNNMKRRSSGRSCNNNDKRDPPIETVASVGESDIECKQVPKPNCTQLVKYKNEVDARCYCIVTQIITTHTHHGVPPRMQALNTLPEETEEIIQLRFQIIGRPKNYEKPSETKKDSYKMIPVFLPDRHATFAISDDIDSCVQRLIHMKDYATHSRFHKKDRYVMDATICVEVGDIYDFTLPRGSDYKKIPTHELEKLVGTKSFLRGNYFQRINQDILSSKDKQKIPDQALYKPPRGSSNDRTFVRDAQRDPSVLNSINPWALKEEFPALQKPTKVTGTSGRNEQNTNLAKQNMHRQFNKNKPLTNPISDLPEHQQVVDVQTNTTGTVRKPPPIRRGISNGRTFVREDFPALQKTTKATGTSGRNERNPNLAKQNMYRESNKNKPEHLPQQVVDGQTNTTRPVRGSDQALATKFLKRPKNQKPKDKKKIQGNSQPQTTDGGNRDCTARIQSSPKHQSKQHKSTHKKGKKELTPEEERTELPIDNIELVSWTRYADPYEPDKPDPKIHNRFEKDIPFEFYVIARHEHSKNQKFGIISKVWGKQKPWTGYKWATQEDTWPEGFEVTALDMSTIPDEKHDHFVLNSTTTYTCTSFGKTRDVCGKQGGEYDTLENSITIQLDLHEYTRPKSTRTHQDFFIGQVIEFTYDPYTPSDKPKIIYPESIASYFNLLDFPDLFKRCFPHVDIKPIVLATSAYNRSESLRNLKPFIIPTSQFIHPSQDKYIANKIRDTSPPPKKTKNQLMQFLRQPHPLMFNLEKAPDEMFKAKPCEFKKNFCIEPTINPMIILKKYQEIVNHGLLHQQERLKEKRDIQIEIESLKCTESKRAVIRAKKMEECVKLTSGAIDIMDATMTSMKSKIPQLQSIFAELAEDCADTN